MERLYLLILIDLFLSINQKFIAMTTLFDQQHNDLLQLRKDLLGNVPAPVLTPPVVVPPPYISEYEPPLPAAVTLPVRRQNTALILGTYNLLMALQILALMQ